jgi:hypothetical protein
VDPTDLTAQHGIFVPQHQQLGVLAQVSPYQHGRQTKQTTQEPVQDRQQQHPTIIHHRPAHKEYRPRRRIAFPSPTRLLVDRMRSLRALAM